MPRSVPPPLIVTATLPGELQARFDALRRAHFPPERNFLAAHVTLFHAIPGYCEEELKQVLGSLAAAFPPAEAHVRGVMSLGRGTAIRLSSPEMLGLRQEVAERFHGMLTAQDSHPPRLHVTVQNKVSPAEAKALQAALTPEIEPREFRFPGFSLYAYEGGPWRFIRSFSFRG